MGTLQKRVWRYSGDVNTLAYGGRFMRRLGPTRFHVIEVHNNHEDEVTSDPHYTIELREIITSNAELNESALRSCGWEMLPSDNRPEGWEDEPDGAVIDRHYGDVVADPSEAPWVIAEAINGYLGSHFTVEDYSGNNGWDLVRQAKRDSRAEGEDVS